MDIYIYQRHDDTAVEIYAIRAYSKEQAIDSLLKLQAFKSAQEYHRREMERSIALLEFNHQDIAVIEFIN